MRILVTLAASLVFQVRSLVSTVKGFWYHRKSNPLPVDRFFVYDFPRAMPTGSVSLLKLFSMSAIRLRGRRATSWRWRQFAEIKIICLRKNQWNKSYKTYFHLSDYHPSDSDSDSDSAWLGVYEMKAINCSFKFTLHWPFCFFPSPKHGVLVNRHLDRYK